MIRHTKEWVRARVRRLRRDERVSGPVVSGQSITQTAVTDSTITPGMRIAAATSAPTVVATPMRTAAATSTPTVVTTPMRTAAATSTTVVTTSMHPVARPQTIRAVGIPRSATIEHLVAALSAKFTDHEKDIVIEGSIVPSCKTADKTNTALLCFKPKVPGYLNPLYEGYDDTQIDTEVGPLSFDKDFFGLTQLYPTPPLRKITADIIAVTGLNGHAYGSWRAGTEPVMWLRDYFSEDLRSCRTMIYGYNSKLGSASFHTIQDYSSGLLEEIKRARRTEEERKRPIIFICHSFGGILVTQSLVIASEQQHDDPEAHSIYEATRALIFFATPHRGLSTENILSMIDVEKHSERAALVKSIDKNSDVLQSQLESFINIASRFRIFSYYEQKKTKKLVEGPNGIWSRSGDYTVPVDTNSALLDLPQRIETKIPVDQDHSTIVKFNSKYGTYLSVIDHLWDMTDEWLLKDAIDSLQDPTNSATKALSQAIDSGDLRLIKLLLKNGAELGHPEANIEWRKLSAAVELGDRDVVNLMCDKLEAKSRNGKTMLHLAAQQGHTTIVQFLLGNPGGVINSGNKYNQTALHLAARSGHEAIVRLLLDNRAEVMVRTRSGWTALHWAALCGHKVIVRLLLDKEAEVGAKATDNGWTALHLAASEGHETIVQLLLTKGALPMGKTNEGKTALQLAQSNRHKAVIRLLQ